MVQEGKISLTPPEELVARIMACKKRPTNAAVRNTSRNTFLKSHGLTRKWGPQDFDEYLRRIQSGRTINEVGNDKDMPNSSMFYDYLRENPRFGKAFDKIWDSLAFAVQARGQKLGKRFEKEIKRLRRAGHMWSDIGRMLECHAGTAQSRWIRMGQKGKLRRGELVVQKVWRSDDYEKFLGRVSTGRTVSEVAADSDMPSLPCFYKYRVRNPAFRKRFEKIWQEVPFAVQARSKHMGEAFKCAIVGLRLQELSWPQIGERTDLKPGTAKSKWSHLKRTGKLPRYIKLAKKALRANEYSSTP